MESTKLYGKEELDLQYRSLQTHKMEQIIGRMNDKKTGIIYEFQTDPFLHCAFQGSAFVSWLQENIPTSDENEAIHMTELFLFYGYIFRITESSQPYFKFNKTYWYRFQAPFYWISKLSKADDIDYAIYLMKRNLKKGGLKSDDPEEEIFQQLSKTLSDKWKIIELQAAEQLRLEKKRNKVDRNILRLQEHAFWKVYRPTGKVKYKLTDELPRNFKFKQIQARQEQMRNKMLEQKKIMEEISTGNMDQDINTMALQLQNDPLINLHRSDKKSIELIKMYIINHSNYDNLLHGDSMKNNWFASGKDASAWEDDSITSPPTGATGSIAYPTLKQARMWATSMDHLIRDVNGQKWLEQFMQKEYSCENFRFLQEVINYKFGPLSKIEHESKRIYSEYLAKTGNSEINVDNYIITVTENLLKNPNPFCFDLAQEHIYNLVRTDSYARFIRSSDYLALVNHSIKAASVQTASSQDKVEQPKK
ncbi:Regulator of G-protein signaling 7 [Schistosoma japonicum]|nr:Regulator of G-protein signaling 7 [Schistosoma japonicum]